MTPALTFEPDGVALAGNQMMGRRAAGSAFLDAAVRGAEDGVVTCYSPHERSAETFAHLVRAVDPHIAARWIRAPGITALSEVGGLHLADPRLGAAARLRLRARSDAWSLSGITHTLSSSGAIGMIAEIVTGPVMPWDALICTSAAARAVVEAVLREQADYLSWRFGTRLEAWSPLLPVIPLGVDPGTFYRADDARPGARQALGIGEAETAFLFAGRLSFHGKAHPFEMLTALNAVATGTEKPITLILAGQFFNEPIAAAYRSAVAQFAPRVRTIVVDGADAVAYAEAWAAADVFVSLADNVQETFGITPVEAMSAGLPVVVTDWDGYRDTVRDGVEGFRVPTWAPAPGSAFEAAAAHDVGALSFDQLASRSSTAVSVDMAVLVERLTTLVDDPALRRRMGEAGRVRVLSEFAWSAVYGRYRSLWREQDAMRRRAGSDRALTERLAHAPREAAPFLDQTTVFADYPTAHVTPTTRVALQPGASLDRFRSLTAHVSLNRWNPPGALVEAWLIALAAGPLPVGELGARSKLEHGAAIDAAARLAKLGIVRLL